MSGDCSSLYHLLSTGVQFLRPCSICIKMPFCFPVPSSQFSSQVQVQLGPMPTRRRSTSSTDEKERSQETQARGFLRALTEEAHDAEDAFKRVEGRWVLKSLESTQDIFVSKGLEHDLAWEYFFKGRRESWVRFILD